MSRHSRAVVPCFVAWVATTASQTPLGAQQPPHPDVFLASLATDSGSVRVGAPRNITARPGYDNQPSFARDGRSVFYTSTRDDAQADIYRFTIASRQTARVTNTAPESEYSASETPQGGAISVIRVERDSAQRLWRLPLGAGEATVLFPTLKPVGYHAWADESRIAMFVLGSPPVLVLGDLRSQRLDSLATNIGRSLQRIPGTTRVSFVSKTAPDAWWVIELNVDTRATRPLVRLPAGTEDYAWLTDRRLIAGVGSTLVVCDVSKSGEWKAVADFTSAGLGSISRLAVSPAGDQIAIVAIPAASPPARP